MAREPAWGSRLDTAGRVLGAVVGGLVPSVLACVLLARVLPLPEPSAATLGILLALPLWAVLIAGLFLFRRAWQVWAASVGLVLALGALVWLLGPMP